MKNYKIKVNNEAESKEAQELFFELGAVWSQSKKAIFNQEPMSFIYFNGSTIYYGHDDENDEYWFLSDSSGKELTLPQLRDLVVLHRNDVKDATHYQTIYPDSRFYLSHNRDVYMFDNSAWVSSGIRPSELTKLKTEQDLISGADAKLAWAKGEDVQILCAFDEFCTITTNLSLSIFDDPKNKFRLKPRTITLSLEIPAPFEPKDKEEAWCLDGNTLDGYKKIIFDDFIDPDIGFWRTEEQIKQVVAVLRGGIKG